MLTRIFLLIVLASVVVLAVGCSSVDGSQKNDKIAFVSDRDGNCEFYVMVADGSGQTRLTSNSAEDRYPDWSPDSSKIAFMSDRDGNWEIYVMGADGSRQTRLINNDKWDSLPSWSPDGSKIAFHSCLLYTSPSPRD